MCNSAICLVVGHKVSIRQNKGSHLLLNTVVMEHNDNVIYHLEHTYKLSFMQTYIWDSNAFI